MQVRDDEEKALRIQAARDQALRDLQDRQQRKMIDMDAVQTQEGVMDSLLEALQTGSAFGNRDQRRQKRAQRPAGAERRAQLNRSRSRGRIGSTSALITREMMAMEAT